MVGSAAAGGEHRVAAIAILRRLRARNAPLPANHRLDREAAHERGRRDLPDEKPHPGS